MEIEKVVGEKKKYIDLLLLADEQEDMIDKYLEHGEMFILKDQGVKAECVITKEGDGIYELKNIAVLPEYQRRGYGKKLIELLLTHYSDCDVLYVGTGDCHSTLSFYHDCGFKKSHRVKNFFVDHYDHPMYEDGIQLVDMVYLKWERKKPCELLQNMDKLHTTELGIERIKRNLSLETEDVVKWCSEKIQQPDTLMTRKGKNWYAEAEECVITVNAYNYGIITAHKKG